jgi:hypothetical protein
MSWYCYCVSRQGLDPAGLKGLQGRPIERIALGPLAMLGSALEPEVFAGVDREGLVPDSRLARLAAEHDTAVGHLFGRGPILPLRLGIFLRDQTGPATLLRRHAADWLRALDRVDGHAEWICKVRAPESQPAARPATAGTESGIAYIERKLSQRRDALEQQEHVTALLERLDAELADKAVDAKPLRSAAPGVMWSMAYLAPRAREAAFSSIVAASEPVLSEQGYELSVTGPWPPYDFATIDLRSEAVHAPA